MKKNALLLSLVLFMIPFWGGAQLVEHIYDFNHLESGNIDGQDDWVATPNTWTNQLMIVDVAPVGLVAPDESLMVGYAQPAPNVGVTASRESTDAFPFNFTVGGILEFEVENHNAWWGTYVGFGYDANDNGYTIPGIEQVVQYENNEGGVFLHTAGKENLDLFLLPDGTTIQIESYDFNGWNRVKFFIDFIANDGEGSITLFYAPIGENFIPLPEVTDINLHLTPGSNDRQDPATWTKFFMHSTGGNSGWDNLVLRQPDTDGLAFQYITFNPLPDKLTTDQDFDIASTASSGLPVSLELISGPASLDGNTISLDGSPGFVTVRATQAGDSETAPAEVIERTFEVVDPLVIIPTLEIKNPVAESPVRNPDLNAVLVSVSTAIDYAHLLQVQTVILEVDDETVEMTDLGNGYFIGYWTPAALGNHTMMVTATSSGGATNTTSVDFEVVEDNEALTHTVLDAVHFDTIGGVFEGTQTLPSVSSGYSTITATLNYNCPSDGCEPWDVISSYRIRGANGEWIDLMRYITPYGVACSHSADVTEIISQLQGKIDFRIGSPNRSVITLELDYEPGTTDYAYSWADPIWDGSFEMGNPTNLQPIPIRQIGFQENVEAADLRIISSGHGWGDNNTGNAAEFYDATHNLKVDNQEAFLFNPWSSCNPNPAGCQPQNGTWFFDRAGWCPGSLVEIAHFDMEDYLGLSQFDLEFEYEPTYIDICHPQNPDCVSGITCPDCNHTSHPVNVINGLLITYSNSPLNSNVISSLEDEYSFESGWSISPNPNQGVFQLNIDTDLTNTFIKVFDMRGKLVLMEKRNKLSVGEKIELSLLDQPKGFYNIAIFSKEGMSTKKLIIQ